MTELYMFDVCYSCRGAGGYNIGDCEEGVWQTCLECNGYGEINDE